jgi:hypothetical protein
MRYAFGNYDFVPRNMVPLRILGEPFDIDMSRPISARGMLQFTKDGLKIQGKIEAGLIGLANSHLNKQPGFVYKKTDDKI